MHLCLHAEIRGVKFSKNRHITAYLVVSNEDSCDTGPLDDVLKAGAQASPHLRI